jgi:hypothetical protein
VTRGGGDMPGSVWPAPDGSKYVRQQARRIAHGNGGRWDLSYYWQRRGGESRFICGNPTSEVFFFYVTPRYLYIYINNHLYEYMYVYFTHINM